MLFSTPSFLFVFLPVFFALYWLLPARRAFLLFGSTVFYAWGEPIFVLVVYLSTLADWLLGRGIAAPGTSAGRRRALVALGVTANVGLLVYVKYAAFAAVNFNALLASFTTARLPVPALVLPLGVSFIVFEKITYLVDIHRGVAPPARSLLDYANYVLLFPKLLAGPIVKYHDIAAQLARPAHRYVDTRDGLIRFIQGLAKKVLIADTLAGIADPIFTLPGSALGPVTAWLGLVSFTLQIYFDFSGYTDMAIGLARALGYRLRENFHDPYLATSFTDFWRRWHISLSTWIKEYVYIPLGGNRVSSARSYVNLCICFVLSGLWHGASWNFVIWGCAHGLALMADRAFWLRAQRSLPRGLNIALTLLGIMLTWVFFRCPAWDDALRYFRALAGWGHVTQGNNVIPQPDAWCVLGAAICLVFAPLLSWRRKPSNPAADPAPAAPPPARRRLTALAACAPLLLLSLARMTLGGFHPFLYFRF